MDIYQCMTCGKRWPHGGLQTSFTEVAQHADETRGSAEGMHQVIIGERQQLAALYSQHQAGNPLVTPNDNASLQPPLVPTTPALSPDRLEEIARRVGMSAQAVEALVLGLFNADQKKPLPEHAEDNVIPSGRLESW